MRTSRAARRRAGSTRAARGSNRESYRIQLAGESSNKVLLRSWRPGFSEAAEYIREVVLKNTILRSGIVSLSLLAVGLLGSRPADASGTDRALLVDLTIEGTQHARVALSVAPNFAVTRPSCHNAGFATHYAFDTSTAKGKTLFSALQAAQLAGKFVTITGANSCTNIGSVTLETVASLTVWTN